MSFTVGVETLNALANAAAVRLRGSEAQRLKVFLFEDLARVNRAHTVLVITHIASGAVNEYSALNDGANSKHVALNFLTDRKTAPAEAGAVSTGSILTADHPSGPAETRTGEKPIARF